MKTNREFLNGVYQKAEVLEKEKNKKKRTYNSYLRYSSVAALFIILPLLLFSKQIINKDNVNMPIVPRTISIHSVEESFNTAEYILVGTIEKVKKNNIIVSIDESFYGDISLDKISIEEYSKTFKKNNKYLLFLNKDENFYVLDSMDYSVEEGLFGDTYGNKYDYEKIKDNIDRRILDEKNN